MNVQEIIDNAVKECDVNVPLINIPAKIEQDLIKVLSLGKWDKRNNKYRYNIELAVDVENRLRKKGITWEEACKLVREKYEGTGYNWFNEI